MIELLQKKIKELYAPNHCYDLFTLEGTNNETKERIAYIEPIIKKLVPGKLVLDVGANKGLFSLLSIKYGANRVIAQDIDKVYTDLLDDIIKYRSKKKSEEKIEEKILVTDEPISKLFQEGDIAFVLGVAHYLTFDYGLDWIYRLYIMGYDLLIEFPDYKEDPIVHIHAHDLEGKGRKIKRENVELLNKTDLIKKTDGLYNVEELGRCPGLGRRLFYCKKNPISNININNIDFENYKKIYDGITKLWLNQKGNAIIKMTGKWASYEDRWIRIQILLKKEFPLMIPGIYYLVKDNVYDTKGMGEEYCNDGKPNNYKNLFKIQNFLLKIGITMMDIHPNHVVGEYIVDLEFIENFDDNSEKYIRNRIPEIWTEENFADKEINKISVGRLISSIKDKNKDIKELFWEAENYIW